MFISDQDLERADWPLLRHGAITLFWRKALFDEAKQDLRNLDYKLMEIVCASPDQVIADVSSGLRWVDQFGYEPWTGNLDALDEGLAGAPFGASGCLALCFERFHCLADQDEALARGMLDVIELQSRHHLLHCRRFLALVQTDDASFGAHPLGARGTMWNHREWLNKARGLEGV